MQKGPGDQIARGTFCMPHLSRPGECPYGLLWSMLWVELKAHDYIFSGRADVPKINCIVLMIKITNGK